MFLGSLNNDVHRGWKWKNGGRQQKSGVRQQRSSRFWWKISPKSSKKICCCIVAWSCLTFGFRQKKLWPKNEISFEHCTVFFWTIALREYINLILFTAKNFRPICHKICTISNWRKTQSLWWGKLGRQGTICWLEKDLSMVHSTLNIFFRNKSFFVFQDRNLKLSASFWFIIAWNVTTLIPPRKMLSESLSKWADILQGFTKSLIKQILKISASCLDKQNSFVPKKIYEVYHAPWIVLSSANRCRKVSRHSPSIYGSGKTVCQTLVWEKGPYTNY